MAETAHPEKPICNVVSLDVHEDGSTIITLRAHGKWIYAEADPEQIHNDALKGSYVELATALRQRREQEQREAEGNAQQIDTQANSAGKTTECKDWASSGSGGKDSGYASDESKNSEEASPVAHEGQEKAGEHQDAADEPADDDAEQDLREFMLEPLQQVLSDAATQEQETSTKNLLDWYNTEMLCFNLEASSQDDTLQPTPRDDLDGQKYIRDTLTPHITLPRYMRNMSHIPWYSPSTITVLSTSDDIHLSIHPTLVRVTPTPDKPTKKNTPPYSPPDTDPRDYYLKLASTTDPHSVKRELRFLHLLQKHSLYDAGIRAPRLEGIVPLPSAPTSHARILGFLLTLIPQPATPLTEYMDSSVSQSKRNTWAAEAERMVGVLHDNGLVWGDAKADNFVVDKEERLWMIDFGGSYTPRWVDAEVADTVEGDEMGTEKVANGVRDPENYLEEGVGEYVEGKVEVVEKRGVARGSGDRSVRVEAGGKRKRDEGVEAGEADAVEPEADGSDAESEKKKKKKV